jgi:hypothetical protein
LSVSTTFVPSDYKVSLVDYTHANSFADDLNQNQNR